MSKIKIIIGLLILIGLSIGWLYSGEQAIDFKEVKFNVNQDPHSADGFGSNSSRIDSQITFEIPEGQANNIYEYLKGKYVARDNILSAQFPKIHLYGQEMSDVSIFTDRYYDTPNLDLYKNTNSVRHRFRVNTTNPEDRKSGRELVQTKITSPGRFDLRTELKYEVEHKSRKPTSEDDLHSLISIIKPRLREDFKKNFTEAGLNALTLRHIFTIEQTRKRGYINWDDSNIISFSVDEGDASILWAKGNFSSVDFGLVEKAYTEANEAKREKMWRIRQAMIADLLEHFPELRQTTNSKYGIVLTDIIRQISRIPILIKLQII